MDGKIVYDSIRQRLLLFAGAGDSGVLDDLWDLQF
jgi:hypothetical protein